MQIQTRRRKGIEREVVIYDVLPGDREDIGDAIERITGDRPWEAEDGTISVECPSSRRARALAAYIEALYEPYLKN